LTINITY